MGRYFWHKAASLLLTALFVSGLTFLILQILPGDPALLILGTEGSPEAYAKLRRELELDRPASFRFFSWLRRFALGKWGVSLRYSVQIEELVKGAVPLSLGIAFLAVTLALLLAIPIGIFLASSRGNPLAGILEAIVQLGVAVPQFWLGLVLIQFFAVRLQLLPPGGNAGFASLILPVVTLALPRAAVLSRFVQSGLAEALEEDFIRTARAKGLPKSVVLYKHGLRNGILAVLTIAGMQFAQLLAGTIVVEQVFGLPGVGQLLLSGVLQRDLPLVQTLVMLITLFVLSFNFLFDLSLGFLDPRIRYE